MLRFSVLFALGVYVFHQLVDLPAWPWLVCEGIAALSVWRFGRRCLPVLPFVPLLLGFAWSHGFALTKQPASLSGDDQALRLVASGCIVSIPDQAGHLTRFFFEARSIEGQGPKIAGLWRMRLSWRDPPPLAAGQCWRMAVRVKVAHGYASPGAWDYEGWLYWQEVRYKGYVSDDALPGQLPAAACCWLTRLRAEVSAALAEMPTSVFARGVLRAIVVGDKSGLSAEARELFATTGTSHLMAISGLHIGLLAGSGMISVAFVWRRLARLCDRVPDRLAGAVAGLLLAGIYAALAGFGLPTQRALLMLYAFTLGILIRRETSALSALAAAAVCVLIWHPPSILAAGFWLSFGAVLAILAVLRWVRGSSRWRQAIAIQLAISFVLWPLLHAFGLPASGAAPVINLILVPVFGFFIVPLALTGAAMIYVVPAAGRAVLTALGDLLDMIRSALVWAGSQPWPDLGGAVPGWPGLVLPLIAAAVLLAPPGIPLRTLALPLILLGWLPRAKYLPAGDFEVHLLDVGQGLSTVVLTRHHTLVFDTGPQFRSGFSTAEAVVVPFLHSRGRRRVDQLILSHGDKDHAGGVEHLLARLRVESVHSGEPDRIGTGAEPCVGGHGWQWDGVLFEYLHPGADTQYSGNDASCVLRVSNAAGSLLLTGDIEKKVEKRLIRRAPAALHSDIVVAPHHGSRSSSSADFVRSTMPSYVLYASGWANRYGFPAPSVVKRWAQAGAVGLNTARLGTISFRYSADGGISAPLAHRRDFRRFWQHDAGLAGPVHAVSSAD